MEHEVNTQVSLSADDVEVDGAPIFQTTVPTLDYNVRTARDGTSEFLGDTRSECGRRKGISVQEDDRSDISDIFRNLQIDDNAPPTCPISGPSVALDTQLVHPLDNDGTKYDIFTGDEERDTLLHVAIFCNENEMANIFIEMAPETNQLDIQNGLFQTPLHLAVLTNNHEVVRTLLRRGANITCRDRHGNTPLHVACESGNLRLVEDLFGSERTNSALEIQNFTGFTCLHVAARNGHYEICRFLIDKGADVNARDTSSGRSVLHFAAETRNIDLVDLLLQSGKADVDVETYDGRTPAFLAYWRNNTDVVRKLVQAGANLDYDSIDELMESDDDES